MDSKRNDIQKGRKRFSKYRLKTLAIPSRPGGDNVAKLASSFARDSFIASSGTPGWVDDRNVRDWRKAGFATCCLWPNGELVILGLGVMEGTSAFLRRRYTWNRFQYYWGFVRGIHRSPVDSAHKRASDAKLGYLYFSLNYCNVVTHLISLAILLLCQLV